MTQEQVANQFIVVSVNSKGNLTPATHPNIHYSEQSVKMECERLAREHPGTLFTYWQFRGVCIKHDVEWTIPGQGR